MTSDRKCGRKPINEWTQKNPHVPCSCTFWQADSSIHPTSFRVHCFEFAGSTFPACSLRLQLCIQIRFMSQNMSMCDWLSVKKRNSIYIWIQLWQDVFFFEVCHHARIELTPPFLGLNDPLLLLHVFKRNLVIFDLTKNQWDELKTAFSLQTGGQGTDLSFTGWWNALFKIDINDC